MKLIVMTQPTLFIEEDRILTSLFDEGMESLHICKPNSSPMYVERLLSLLPEDFYDNIFVHNHFYLRNEYRLAGINLEDENDCVPKEIKGKVTCTCNRIESLADKSIRKKFHYILLNNCFAAEGGLTMKQLENAAAEGYINKKVYAMGGITADNIKLAAELGFGGVVLRSDLWNRFDIHKQDSYNGVLNYFANIIKIIGQL